MQDIKLIPATPNDIEAISELANVIWNQHYPSIISQPQIDYMLALNYSSAALREQMEKKGHRFFLILSAGKNIGFISVHEEENTKWFLNKFYINQQVAAKGIGALAFEQLLDVIKPAKITLTVNRQNHKSINFYFKNGFKIERVADFDIGNGYVMNDFVMGWMNRH